MSLRPKSRPSYALAAVLAVACLLSGPASPLTSPKLQSTRSANPELASLQQRAAKGDAQAQEQLGTAYRFGQRGLTMNHALARRWLQRAADAGRPYSAGLLSGMFREGLGGPVDVAQADRLLRLAATRGDARSQAEIGYQQYAKDTAQARAEGLRWIRAAARQGDTYALSLLAYDYQYSPEEVDNRLDRVIGHSLRGAQLGDVEAIGRTGMLFYNQRDLREALPLLEEAGSKGHWPSAFQLGYHFWDGRRAARDGEQAVKWLKLAAQNGSQPAELVLAQCTATGFGVRRNVARAEQMFAAADQLDPGFRNDFAWQLAVSPHDDVRDGARAVRIMEAVLARRENVSASRVDTLAAAYAEAGRFEDAAKTQRRAISLLAQDPQLKRRPDALARSRKDFESRLALYVSGKPYRRET